MKITNFDEANQFVKGSTGIAGNQRYDLSSKEANS